MIIVYHGTTSSRANSIIQDKMIYVTDTVNQRYSNTSPGYVYVTKRLGDAMEFSSRTAEKGISTINVFRIHIEEAELEIDTDEKKWQSVLSPNGVSACYRIPRNLVLGKDVDAFFTRSFGKDHPSCGDYFQAVQLDSRVVSEDEWVTL